MMMLLEPIIWFFWCWISFKGESLSPGSDTGTNTDTGIDTDTGSDTGSDTATDPP